ncbi:MAG: hypothetical protein JWQ14_3351 [Adhaeribacter sp.]|nr:hypothetical protein [Adhaeribacter sp.]
MILHKDGLIELRYEIKTDVLYVKWPDLTDTPVQAIEYSFTKLIQTINNYYITKLIIDSKNTVSEMKDENYRIISMRLGQALLGTGLKKIARVISDSKERETNVQDVTKEMQSQGKFNLNSKEFTDIENAVSWITQKEEETDF